jgi:hypothetical protein
MMLVLLIIMRGVQQLNMTLCRKLHGLHAEILSDTCCTVYPAFGF